MISQYKNKSELVNQSLIKLGLITYNQGSYQTAIDYYKQYDFTKAITYFDLVKAEVPAYQIDFFKVICYMSLKEPNLDEALKQFNLVITTDNDYNQQARWYKAIVFLKQKNLVSARQILEEIVDNKSYNYLEAKKILDLHVTIK